MKCDIGYVYEIRNLVTGKFYIGSTVNWPKRYSEHITSLRKNKHHCTYLQRSFNLYGEGNFKFTVIYALGNNILRQKEQELLLQYKQKSYNCSLNAFGGSKAKLFNALDPNGVIYKNITLQEIITIGGLKHTARANLSYLANNPDKRKYVNEWQVRHLNSEIPFLEPYNNRPGKNTYIVEDTYTQTCYKVYNIVTWCKQQNTYPHHAYAAVRNNFLLQGRYKIAHY